MANTESIYQGVTYDTDLSVLGKAQAHALALCFDKIDIAEVVASPLKRTLQTAKVVADRKKLPLRVVNEIVETNHGVWEGKHKKVVQETWPRIYKNWLKFPSGTKFPQGEHFLETQKRVLTWWQIFYQNIHGDVLVVTHDNIIRIIVSHTLKMKLNKIWRFHLQPTSITHILILNGQAKLVKLGDSAHLASLSVDLSKQAL